VAETDGASRYPEAAALVPSEPERRVLDAAARGKTAAFNANGPDDARTLRAELLTALLLGLRDDWPVHPRGLRLKGAVVTGRFGLGYARNPASRGAAAPSFVFDRCTFREPVVLSGAHLAHVVFGNCRLPGVDGASLRCALLSLRGSRIDGAIYLGGAAIDGSVDADGVTGVTHVELGGSRVSGDVLFRAPSREGEGEADKPRSLRLDGAACQCSSKSPQKLDCASRIGPVEWV